VSVYLQIMYVYCLQVSKPTKCVGSLLVSQRTSKLCRNIACKAAVMHVATVQFLEVMLIEFYIKSVLIM